METPLRNILLVLSYDGTGYCGWQRQINGLSIQEVVEARVKTMCGGEITLIASGRTDAGVHARAQVCNFTTTSTLSVDTLKKGLNSLLPQDIFIISADDAPIDFHARYDAKSKVYAYHIRNREDRDPFERNRHWHIPRPLDMGPMGECLALLMGTHDFSAFKSAGSENRNPVRTVIRAELCRSDEGLVTIQLAADGFLRHMVRNIVGTVVEAGLGKMDQEGFRAVLESKDRQQAGMKAPAQGLFLMEVRY